MISFNEEQFEKKIESIFLGCLHTVFDDYFKNQSKEDNQDPDKLLTKKEAAELLSCATSTIDNYRRSGIIKRHYIGSSVRFKRTELLDAVKKMSTK